MKKFFLVSTFSFLFFFVLNAPHESFFLEMDELKRNNFDITNGTWEQIPWHFRQSYSSFSFPCFVPVMRQIERNKSRMFRSIQVESINRLILSFNHIWIPFTRLCIIYKNWYNLRKIIGYINHRKILRFYFLNCVLTREKPSDDELLYMCREEVFIRVYIRIYVDVGGRALCLGEMRANK